MFREILRTQWKWSAWAVVLVTIASFVLPVLTVQDAGLVDPEALDVVAMMVRVEIVGTFYPILAQAAGIAMALLIWAPDHRGNHVYALSLPVPRWRYTLLRLAAGAVLLAPAVLALWIGALVATGVSTIPVGLHAYPATIAVRFAVALLLAYALFFALASGTMRTTVILLGIVPVALLTLNAFLVLVGGPNLLVATARWIGSLPGPFRLMFDAWLLINV
jgi:hypothetical protein